MKKTKVDFTPDFIQIPQLVMHLPPADRFVFGVIYFYSQLSEKECRASNATIGRVAHISPDSVSNSLIKLEEEGLIKRYFKDDNKRTRDRIECLVRFNKIPPGNGKDAIRQWDNIPSGDGQIKNKDKEDINIYKDEIFNSDEYLRTTIDGKNRLASIVAVFASKKKKVFKDRKSASAFIYSGENLKYAKDLKDFSDKEILDAMNVCDDYIIDGQRTNWSLRAVVKAINK